MKKSNNAILYGVLFVLGILVLVLIASYYFGGITGDVVGTKSGTFDPSRSSTTFIDLDRGKDPLVSSAITSGAFIGLNYKDSCDTDKSKIMESFIDKTYSYFIGCNIGGRCYKYTPKKEAMNCPANTYCVSAPLDGVSSTEQGAKCQAPTSWVCQDSDSGNIPGTAGYSKEVGDNQIVNYCYDGYGKVGDAAAPRGKFKECGCQNGARIVSNNLDCAGTSQSGGTAPGGHAINYCRNQASCVAGSIAGSVVVTSATGAPTTYSRRCSGTSAISYTCNGAVQAESVTPCVNGCSGPGVCAGVTCSDSDAPNVKDLNADQIARNAQAIVRGTATIKAGTVTKYSGTDACVGDNNILEYWCNAPSDGYLSAGTFRCPSDKPTCNVNAGKCQ